MPALREAQMRMISPGPVFSSSPVGDPNGKKERRGCGALPVLLCPSQTTVLLGLAAPISLVPGARLQAGTRDCTRAGVCVSWRMCDASVVCGSSEELRFSVSETWTGSERVSVYPMGGYTEDLEMKRSPE